MAIIKKDNTHNPFKVDEGMYKAVIASIDEKEGKTGPYLLWSFKVPHPMVDGEPASEPMNVAGFTPLIIQDDTKLDKWLKACGINVAEDGDEFDTEDLIGKKVQVLVENKVNKTSGQEKSQVTKLLRAPAAQPGQQDEAPARKAQPKPQGAPPKAPPKAAPKRPVQEEEPAEAEDDPIENPPPRKKPAAPQQKPAAQQKPARAAEEEVERPDTDDPSMWEFEDGDDADA